MQKAPIPQIDQDTLYAAAAIAGLMPQTSHSSVSPVGREGSFDAGGGPTGSWRTSRGGLPDSARLYVHHAYIITHESGV